MNLNQQQLINLPVYTESNDFLGRVSDFEFNPDTHTIIKYFINQSSLVKDLLGSLSRNYDLVVAAAQVISITEEKMLVEDSIAEELKQAKAKKQPAPVSTSASFFNLSKR